MSFLFSTTVRGVITLDDAATRPKVTVKYKKGLTDELYRFTNHDDVRGSVTFVPNGGKRVEHLGIRVQLIGQVETPSDHGVHFEFTSLLCDLAPAGAIQGTGVTLPFAFQHADLVNESYNGTGVRLRYFIRATLFRSGLSSNVVKEMDIWVVNYDKPPQMNNTIKMEVGIEDCLHIEFEYNKSKYHLKDVIIGKVYFLLVRLRIKHMELCLIKRETYGTAPNLVTESDTLTKFEIMDGAPVKGESIPVRLFLGQFDLTPTYRDIQSKFSVKYFLNLVLVDDDDRRYFKQQEITLWRRPPHRIAAAPAAAATTDAAAPETTETAPAAAPAEVPATETAAPTDPSANPLAEQDENKE